MSSNSEIRRSSAAVAPAEQHQQPQAQGPQVGKCERLRKWTVNNPNKTVGAGIVLAIVLLGMATLVLSGIQGNGFNGHSLDWLNDKNAGYISGAIIGTIIVAQLPGFGLVIYEMHKRKKEQEASDAEAHAASPDRLFDRATRTGVPTVIDGATFDAPTASADASDRRARAPGAPPRPSRLDAAPSAPAASPTSSGGSPAAARSRKRPQSGQAHDPSAVAALRGADGVAGMRASAVVPPGTMPIATRPGGDESDTD